MANGYHSGNRGTRGRFPLWRTKFVAGRVTMLVMPPRIGPKRPQRVYLRQWREHKKLSLEEVGGRFDPPVGKGTVSKIEEKPAYLLTLGVLQEYADALQLSDFSMLYRLPPPKDEADPLALERAVPTLNESERGSVLGYIAGMRGRKAS